MTADPRPDPGLSDLVRADLAKLHSEVNQFRNQEFWVCSFAIALFGATARELAGKPHVAFAVLLLLAGLYGWHYTLTATRTRLTSYLRRRGLSRWEADYRLFANRVRWPSQRYAALLVFAVLGLMTPVAAAWDDMRAALAGHRFTLDDPLVWYYLLPGLLYQAVVLITGLRGHEPTLAYYDRIWDEVLAGSDVRR